jgi:(2Fe-2S) ferredoxin
MPINLLESAQEIGIGKLKRHIFICCGPNCCSHQESEDVWNYCKDRLRKLGLTGSAGTVHRTKADCLRICQQGPIVVVYPEGTWYHRVDKTKMEQIIQNHLVQGKPLTNESFATNPLST